MKTLVAYYSRSGNTEIIAGAIARALGAEIERILDVKSRAGPWNYIKSAFESLFRYKPPIRPLKKLAKNYDLVILGSPIWAGRMASPMLTYIEKNEFKKAAYFCTMGGSEGKYFKQVEDVVKKPKATLAITEAEIKSKKFDSKVDEFVKKLR